MKKDWSAIHKLLDALKDVENTEDLHVYISIHRLRDAEIDDVMRKVPAGYEKKEEMNLSGGTGWTKAVAKFDKFGFSIVELTMFFGVYSKTKHEARLMSKGGDIK